MRRRRRRRRSWKEMQRIMNRQLEGNVRREDTVTCEINNCVYPSADRVHHIFISRCLFMIGICFVLARFASRGRTEVWTLAEARCLKPTSPERRNPGGRPSSNLFHRLISR